jgi:hypothetical protein
MYWFHIQSLIIFEAVSNFFLLLDYLLGLFFDAEDGGSSFIVTAVKTSNLICCVE